MRRIKQANAQQRSRVIDVNGGEPESDNPISAATQAKEQRKGKHLLSSDITTIMFHHTGFLFCHTG